MGPVLAIGMAVTVLAGVTLLPAVARRARNALPASSARRRRCGRGSARSSSDKPLALDRRRRSRVLVAGALGNLKRPRHARLQRAVPRRRRSPSTACARLQEKFPPGQAGPGRRRSIDARRPSPTALPGARRRRRLLRRPRRRSASDGKPRARPRHARPGPVHRARDGRDPADPRASRASYDPNALVGGPTAEILDSRDRLSRDAQADRPARARARLPDRRRCCCAA